MPLYPPASNSSAATPTAPPTVQRFTSSSGTYNKNYTFIISSGSATIGATYTNNGITYTVYATVSSAVQVVMSGSGAPTSSGTLTKASGTGDSTITFSQVLAPLFLEAIVVGGGGQGGGSGTGAAAGQPGGNSTFGSSLLTANGGAGGGAVGGGGGAGGSVTVNSPAIALIALTGTRGGVADGNGATTTFTPGGYGGAGPFGSGSGSSQSTGQVGNANSGSGGSGAGSASSTTGQGGGGGAGGYIAAIITAPSATYSFAVGAGGTGAGGAGTNGAAGGDGGSGIVVITEYYQ